MAIKRKTASVMDGDTDLIAVFQQLMDKGQCMALWLNSSTVVVVDGATGVFYDPEGVAAKLTGRVKKVKCRSEKLSRQKMGEWLSEHRPRSRPIEELLWTIGFTGYESASCCSKRGCRTDDVIQLKRWPNLTRLPKTANTIRLVSLFSMRPTSVFLASRILKIEEDEVMRFYSAACYSGLAVRMNGNAKPYVPKPHRQKKLIKLIFKYLSGRQPVRNRKPVSA